MLFCLVLAAVLVPWLKWAMWAEDRSGFVLVYAENEPVVAFIVGVIPAMAAIKWSLSFLPQGEQEITLVIILGVEIVVVFFGRAIARAMSHYRDIVIA